MQPSTPYWLLTVLNWHIVMFKVDVNTLLVLAPVPHVAVRMDLS